MNEIIETIVELCRGQGSATEEDVRTMLLRMIAIAQGRPHQTLVRITGGQHRKSLALFDGNLPNDVVRVILADGTRVVVQSHEVEEVDD